MTTDSFVSAGSTPNRLLPEVAPLVRRHARFGWWSLLVFLTFGIALEALHGFKAAMYLNVSNEMRRLMWTLAHAHGTVLSIVNIAFAVTLPLASTWTASSRALASSCLMGASVLLPGGFFLGGLFLYHTDPGLGIVLVPIGALLLLVAVLMTARAVTATPPVTNAPAAVTEPSPRRAPGKGKMLK